MTGGRAEDRAMGPDVAGAVSEILKALADPLRLRVLSAIATSADGEASAGELAAMTDPLVVEVEPGQPELVALTAAAWARDAGVSELYFAYVDGSRFTREEYADGTVLHEAVDPDGLDASWQDRQRRIEGFLERVLADEGVSWQLRYLAGRADRALAHLARAVDAAGFVLGTRAPAPDHACGSSSRDPWPSGCRTASTGPCSWCRSRLSTGRRTLSGRTPDGRRRDADPASAPARIAARAGMLR